MATEIPKDSIVLRAWRLKDVLYRFPADSELLLLELGDTWHPASGFVDETYFAGHQKIADWLAEDYDFKGLLLFHAQVDGFELRLEGKEFLIVGEQHKIEVLRYGAFFDVLP
jgi:hypothetical protein